MSSRFSRQTFEITCYLGSLVGKDNPFMRDIACMTPEWREIMALLEILKKLWPEDKALQEDIEKVLKPVCQYMGQAEWNPDVITHLAMKLGDLSTTYDVT
ncbi:hypothetical protein MUP01_12745 [Candidatus Bathyarchaeota archaeon]|jgi:trehalose-6-phosphate synthase|nr:hypothetical protein [Candidatus Bathyarchaeota archaeon]